MGARAALDFGRKPAVPFRAPLERMRARHAAAADLRAQLRPVACPPLAPELLVALGPLVAVGARGDGSGRPGSGWTVQLLQAGESVALLSAGDARALARDLSEMADVIEGRAE